MENDQKDEFFDPAPSQAPEQAPASAPKSGRGLRIAALVLAAVLLAAAGFLGGWFGHYYSLDGKVREYLWAKSVLEKNYYRPLDDAELYESLFDSLAVDPYTEYFSPEEYSKDVAEGAGKNTGVGLAFYRGNYTDEEIPMRIFLVYENSPAARAGLKKGMYVLGFGTSGEDLKTGNYPKLKEFMAEQNGAIVLRCGFDENGSDAELYQIAPQAYQSSFLFYRDSESSFHFTGEGKTLSLTETNEPLQGLDEKTAYLCIEEFSGNNTASEIVQLLSKMKERGREDLIIDLRSNGGGYMDIMGSISSHFIRSAEQKNPVVVVTESRDGGITRYVCTNSDFDRYFTPNSRIAVLADEHTASASECFIGVLVDYGAVSFSDIYLRRGENGTARTFGKGIMQTIFTGANGSAMKVTTATVKWPSGKCIHGVGVTEEDGAVGIAGDLFWGEPDVMLQEVLSRFCGAR